MRILVQESLFPFSVAKYSFFNGQLEVGEEDYREELCSLIFKISLIFLQAPKFCPPPHPVTAQLPKNTSPILPILSFRNIPFPAFPSTHLSSFLQTML